MQRTDNAHKSEAVTIQHLKLVQFGFSAVTKVGLGFLPQKVGIDPIISYTNFYWTITVYDLIVPTAFRYTWTVLLKITNSTTKEYYLPHNTCKIHF